MIIAPFFPFKNGIVPECIKANLIVYAIEATFRDGYTDGPHTLLSDMAWTNRIEVNSHFWIKNLAYGGLKREDIKVIRLRLDDYIKRHVQEIRGMNAFWDLGRIEFLDQLSKVGALHANMLAHRILK